MLDISLIPVFLEVAKTKSLVAAAQNLFVTQSAVSQRIKILENYMGTTLFHRKRQGLALNAQGEMFFKQCFQIHNNFDQLNKWIDQQKGYIGGTIKVAFIAGFQLETFPKFLGKFLAKYPLIAIETTSAISANIEEMVIEGEYDIGVIAGITNKSSLTAINLGDNPIYMVCSPDYPLAQKKKITKKDLANARMIWHSDKKSRTASRIAKKLGLSNDGQVGNIRVSDMISCKSYALQSLGVTFIALKVMKQELKDKRLKILPGFVLEGCTSLICRNEKYETPALKLFKEEFVRFCREHY